MEFQFGEVNVICTDLDRSLEFYTSTLGFKEIERDGGGVHLACGSQRVLLLPFAKEGVAEGEYCKAACISFDLYTKNIDEAYSYFKARGVKLLFFFQLKRIR